MMTRTDFPPPRPSRIGLAVLIGVALDAVLLGLTWIVFLSAVWQWAGVLLILAAGFFFFGLWWSERDRERDAAVTRDEIGAEISRQMRKTLASTTIRFQVDPRKIDTIRVPRNYPGGPR